MEVILGHISTEFNAVFVLKLLISGSLFSISVSFNFLTKSVTSGIFFSNSVLSADIWFLKQNHLFQYYLYLQPAFHKQFFNNFFYHIT